MIQLIHGFGFASFEFGPPLLGSLCRIHTRCQVGFFQEIAPAFVTVIRGLALFEFSDGTGRVLLAPNNLNYTCGYVSSNIVSDDCVRGFRFVVGQKYSELLGFWIGAA